MLNFNKYLFSTILTVAFSISIFAQEVEEVVVTATKKEESTQDIAISVEAFTADMIADEQIYDLSDLTEVVPGFGFGKNMDHNIALYEKLDHLKAFNLPLLIGVSRKSMFKNMTIGAETPEGRLVPSLIASLWLLERFGPMMIRTHDILETRQAWDTWRYLTDSMRFSSC